MTAAGSELVPLANPDDIANLPMEQRGQMITRALVESKQWLAVATKGTDPTPISEFKAWAATVAEMTRQKGLAEEIQLDALEMVRRAERGIGIVIREGQRTGVIATKQEAQRWGGKNRAAQQAQRNGKNFSLPPRPAMVTDFVSTDDMSGNHAGIAHVTDGVSDDEFDEALADARDEGNLSRANVARKVRSGGLLPQAEKIARVADMAARNHSSRQIADAIGMRIDALRKLAAREHIDIPADAVMAGRTRRINPERVIAETVDALEGLALGVGLLAADDYAGLNPDQVKEWANSLTASLSAIGRMKKEMIRAHG